MVRLPVTEKEIVNMTRENVRSFYRRKKEETTTPMTDDFMWIGTNAFQWCEGQEEFGRVTGKEYGEPSAIVSDEEYHMLFHERNVWVVYGRYKITAELDDGSVIYAHVRGTYVWRKIGGEIKLAHVHGSHAQDIPMNHIAKPEVPLMEDTAYFEYLKQMDLIRNDVSKIGFRDQEKNYRYLYPSDILYIKAAAQWSVVHTKDGSFKVWGLIREYEEKLPSSFRRIHKSYLVNSMYIDSIHRYGAVLKGGQELPIGKERYMDLKRYMQGIIYSAPAKSGGTENL